ncbi:MULTISPECIES: hypothetical protein [unclassified Acinetobacter]|uniref:hypothetical protein n=1 Tax=Acinetobacter TaxID=469 RepID=UPI0025753470|nr:MULTISPECIES: hypothetical protein [unclassified Acinetobacter]MDM1757539.1 hypothetical protein [Acinetobacter sp. 256-1]MDM1761552.1 hypothetical protein [Acinetobacter sp. 251-1]
MKLIQNSLVALALGTSSILTGCATATLLDKDDGIRTKTVKNVLINDYVVAFGKPAQALPNIPQDSIVIVGQQYNYVLTHGGAKFAKVISALDPKNIQVTRSLDFYSAKNDGNFSGSLDLSYIKLAEDVSKADREFFIENGAKECTNSSDQRLKAQRFCFDIKLAGVVYPAASNRDSFKALSKPYRISIYTQTQEKDYSQASSNAANKLMLFPFAVAFDVVTLPFQAIHKIFD